MNENQISKLNLQKKNQQTKILFIIEEIKKKNLLFFCNLLSVTKHKISMKTLRTTAN